MWHAALDKLQYAPVPVVAVLHGAVIGGGLEIAAAAHIRVAERSAYYGLPEGQRGLFVGGGGSMRLPRLIGASRMADMMLTGRVYRAEEGERVGFAASVVPIVERDRLLLAKGRLCGATLLVLRLLDHAAGCGGQFHDGAHAQMLRLAAMWALTISTPPGTILSASTRAFIVEW